MKNKLYKAFQVYVVSFLIVIGLFITVISISFYSAPDSRAPKSVSELCNALGRNPKDDPLCTWRRLSELLRESFPIGEATIDEVNDALGRYLLYWNEKPIGGTTQTYAIRKVVCCIRPEAVFSYGEDGVLTHIDIYD